MMYNQAGFQNLMQENALNFGPILLQIKESLIKEGFSLRDSHLMSDDFASNNTSKADASIIMAELSKARLALEGCSFALIIDRAIGDLQNIGDIDNILVAISIRLFPELLDMDVGIAGDGSLE